MTSGVFPKSVSIRNYKRIAECDVNLGRLTLLVGRNGSGKSNFLDALCFVTESLETSVDHARRDRGGITAVRRISTGHPRNFYIGLQLHLQDQAIDYNFEYDARVQPDFLVSLEPGR
jgi:predicted ATPase